MRMVLNESLQAVRMRGWEERSVHTGLPVSLSGAPWFPLLLCPQGARKPTVILAPWDSARSPGGHAQLVLARLCAAVCCVPCIAVLSSGDFRSSTHRAIGGAQEGGCGPSSRTISWTLQAVVTHHGWCWPCWGEAILRLGAPWLAEALPGVAGLQVSDSQLLCPERISQYLTS